MKTINLLAFCLFTLCFTCPLAPAADHRDGPTITNDAGADLADVFFFLDPNDNTKAVLIMTVGGFTVPGEASNEGIFDNNVLYRIEIENTGDAKPDKFIDITFNHRSADPGPSPRQILQVPKAQTASVKLPNGRKFTAPVLNPSLGASSPAQAVTSNAGGTGVDFFAGEVDDPFFFDIPAFSAFVASVRNGSPDPSQLSRGRDTFAGYNAMAIALRMPVSLIKGAGNIIGVDAVTQRGTQSMKKNGQIKSMGPFKTIDREGNPAVNTVLVPFNRKDEYNASNTKADAQNVFANDIVATLTALGTSQPNIAVLAGVAVNKGDFLHLDVSVPNTGTNSNAAFPNGRRLQDDVVDTLLSIITNGAITTGDNVNANDLAFNSTFPFLAATQQPRATGTVDDNTRN